MGATQSFGETRSVSMENPTPAGVIDVSDEVVQRLKLGISKAKKQSEAPKLEATALTVDEPPKRPVSVLPVVQPTPADPPKVQFSKPTPSITPPPAFPSIPNFAGDLPITAREMRRQKEIELQQNDQMWRSRMAQLEQTLNKTNVVMEKEYSAAVEEVRKSFMNASPAYQLPPCQDLKAQLITCYLACPGETLKCAEKVAQFRNCVGLNRIKKLDSEPVPAKGA